MRTRLTVVVTALGAALLTGCSGPDAAATTAPIRTDIPTAVSGEGAQPTESAVGTGLSSIRLATPLPQRPTVAPLQSIGAEDPADDNAYIDDFLEKQWASGVEASSPGEVAVGDCVFFDWEYSSGPTTTALFPVSCEDPHEGEVFGVITHSDGVFPGSGALGQEAGIPCSDVLLEYLEARLIPYAVHRVMSPTEADWASGERTSVCLFSPGFLVEDDYFGN